MYRSVEAAGKALFMPSQRSLLVPHFVSSLQELSYAQLKQDCGVKAVVFDKDSTLTLQDELYIQPQVQQSLETCIEVFGAENVAVMSNSVGSVEDRQWELAQEFEDVNGVRVVRHGTSKPDGIQQLLQHFHGKFTPRELVCIGDRILTDVLFGNLYGMVTVCCHALPAAGRRGHLGRIIREKELYFVRNWVMDQGQLPPRLDPPVLHSVSNYQWDE